MYWKLLPKPICGRVVQPPSGHFGDKLASRFTLERGSNNKGFMSPFALEGLRARGVTVANLNRFPLPCSVDALKNADRVIALHDGEHRPLMQERFPDWEHRIIFWDVEDVEFMQPSLALARLDKQLDVLLRTLHAERAPN